MLLRSSEVRLLFIDLYQHSTQHSVVVVVPPPNTPNNPPVKSLISDAPTHNATSAPELTTSAVLHRLCHCISRIPEFQCSGASVEQCAASETAADQAAPCTTRGCGISIVCQFCASQHSPSASLTQTIRFIHQQHSILFCASQHSPSAALTVSNKPSD